MLSVSVGFPNLKTVEQYFPVVLFEKNNFGTCFTFELSDLGVQMFFFFNNIIVLTNTL